MYIPANSVPSVSIIQPWLQFIREQYRTMSTWGLSYVTTVRYHLPSPRNVRKRRTGNYIFYKLCYAQFYQGIYQFVDNWNSTGYFGVMSERIEFLYFVNCGGIDFYLFDSIHYVKAHPPVILISVLWILNIFCLVFLDYNKYYC